MTIKKLIEFAETGDKNTDDLDLDRGFPSRLMPARQWFNWLFNSLTVKVNELIDVIDSPTSTLNLNLKKLNDSEVGVIKLWLSTSIPENHLEIKGQILNKSDYPVFFKNYGITAGQFTLPNTRGEFVRGFDNGRGIDSDRILGSYQEDDLKAHTHKYFRDNTGGGAASAGGSNSGNDADTGSTGGIETRPRNIAMIYIIKVE